MRLVFLCAGQCTVHLFCYVYRRRQVYGELMSDKVGACLLSSLEVLAVPSLSAAVDMGTQSL